MVSNKKEKQWIRANGEYEVKILFEEASASLITDFMYMFSQEKDGITYDAFKHKETRKYIFIPKRGDGLRLTEQCTN
ncbi:MAG: hypothetical protein CL755_12535 [Chloroflexi bacterium]|nr:hypothetical protein [Chloroflexota bacterium]|tara:strand:+ start:2656 stop:2886 length:231 start_codon:yes stop_codon:yes gene_type:complete